MLQLINKLTYNFFDNSWEIIVFKLYYVHIEILLCAIVLYFIWLEFDKSNKFYVILAVVSNKINERREAKEKLKLKKYNEHEVESQVCLESKNLNLINWISKKSYRTTSENLKDPNYIPSLNPVPNEKIEKANKDYFEFLNSNKLHNYNSAFLKRKKKSDVPYYDFSKYKERSFDRIDELTHNPYILYYNTKQDLRIRRKQEDYPILNFTQNKIYTPEYNRQQLLSTCIDKKTYYDMKKGKNIDFTSKNVKKPLIQTKSDTNYSINYIKHMELLNKKSNKKYKSYGKKYPEIEKIVNDRIELNKNQLKIKLENERKHKIASTNKLDKVQTFTEKNKLLKKKKTLQDYHDARIKKSLSKKKLDNISEKKNISNLENTKLKKNSFFDNVKNYFFPQKTEEIEKYNLSERTSADFHKYYNNLKSQMGEYTMLKEKKLKKCAEQDAINLEEHKKYVESWSTYKTHPNEEIDRKIKEIGSDYFKKTRKSYYPISQKEKYLMEQIFGPQKKQVWSDPLKNIKNYPPRIDRNLPCFKKEFWEKRKTFKANEKKKKYSKLIEYIEERRKFKSDSKLIDFKFSECKSDKEKLLLFKKIYELRKKKKFNFTKDLNEKYNMSINDLQGFKSKSYWYNIRNKNKHKKYDYIKGDLKKWHDNLWFEERRKERLYDNKLSPHGHLILQWHRKEYSYYGWNYIIDQIFFSLPIFIVFCLTQLILASIIITKFKCQQHYKIYHWILGLGPVILGYIALYILNMPWLKRLDSKYNWQISNYPKFNTIEWPIYIGLYQWWVILICYAIVTIVFYYFAPNSIYLRSTAVMKPWLVIRSFLLCCIFLLAPPLFAQDRIPFWYDINKLLFSNVDTYGHWGIFYLLAIFFLMAICSIIIFHFIILVPLVINYIMSKDKTYLTQIKYLLYDNIQDNQDWDFKEGVPKILVDERLQTFEMEDEDWDEDMQSYTLDGSYYYLPDKNNYYLIKKGWKASISKNILIAWVFINCSIGLLVYTVFQYKGFIIALASIYILFLFLFLFLIVFILKYKLTKFLNTLEYQIYFLIFIFLNYKFITMFWNEFCYIFTYFLK